MRTLHEQRQALEWFERSLEQPVTERDAWLDEHCADSAVRARVKRLQLADTDDDDFLDEPYSPAVVATIAPSSRIGAYCIDELLAEGGMGSVYLAHRDDGVYQQQVAVKFLHPLLRNPEARRRFAAERQILAQLQHPNIAQMLDAGTSDDGVPYVVMEYVDGIPITEYCRQHSLPLSARLDLLRQVCSAVATAHRALIVHRDLKPGNILVTNEGRPMLLDFGIAKILQEDDAVDQGARATTMVALTPAYASPEQIQRHAITTSSDIYSLGVLLYELLCGKRPYDLDRLTPAQAEQMVCDTVPPVPSQIAAANMNRAFGPQPRALRGDLDVITMKALRKEPARRYGSVQELSQDVHRYLRGLPILARADSLGYRMHKFVGRNRWGVVAAAVIVLSLIGGLLTTSWQAHKAQQQAARAEAQQVRAEHINDFFKKILMSPSSQWLSSLGKGADVSMGEVLEVASQRADTELAQYPDVHVDVLNTLSQVFQGMGLFDQAEDAASRALKVAQDKLPSDNRLRMISQFRLAQSLLRKNDLTRSERHFQRAIAMADKLSPAAEATALMHNDLSVLYIMRGRFDAAKPELSKALALQRQRMHGQPNPAIAIGLGNLGFISTSLGDLDGGLKAFNEALAMFARLPGREYVEVATSLVNRSRIYTIRGEFEAAEADARKAVDIAARKSGHLHPRYSRALLRHAETMLDLGKTDGVEESLDQAEKIMKQRLVPGHKSWGTLDIVRARWDMVQGRYEPAAELLLAAHRVRETQLGPASGRGPDRDEARSLALLGEVRLAQGRPAEAADLLQQGIEIETALYGPDVQEVRQFRKALKRSRDALAAQDSP